MLQIAILIIITTIMVAYVFFNGSKEHMESSDSKSSGNKSTNDISAIGGTAKADPDVVVKKNRYQEMETASGPQAEYVMYTDRLLATEEDDLLETSQGMSHDSCKQSCTDNLSCNMATHFNGTCNTYALKDAPGSDVYVSGSVIPGKTVSKNGAMTYNVRDVSSCRQLAGSVPVALRAGSCTVKKDSPKIGAHTMYKIPSAI